MERQVLKDLNKITKDCEAMLVITSDGVLAKGSSPELLALYSTLTGEMLNLKGVTREMLDRNYRMAFMSTEELEKEMDKTLEKWTETLKNLRKMVGGEDE